MKRKSVEFYFAEKTMGPFTVKVITTDNPAKLDVFMQQTGGLTTEVFITHSLKAPIVSGDKTEELLGNTCPFCNETLRYYAGEFQNRIHCGCTMVMFPISTPNLEEDEEDNIVGEFISLYGPDHPEMWRTVIEHAQKIQRDAPKK